MCKKLGLENYELSVSFVGSKQIKELNKQHRNRDSSTDVLSFPQETFTHPIRVENHEPALLQSSNIPLSLGDLVISVDDARKNAIKIGQSLEREIAFLIVHGILHLVGHNHIKEAEELEMLHQQKILIDLAGESTPPLWKGIIQTHGD